MYHILNLHKMNLYPLHEKERKFNVSAHPQNDKSQLSFGVKIHT